MRGGNQTKEGMDGQKGVMKDGRRLGKVMSKGEVVISRKE